jgi:hypothetical protein
MQDGDCFESNAERVEVRSPLQLKNTGGVHTSINPSINSGQAQYERVKMIAIKEELGARQPDSHKTSRLDQFCHATLDVFVPLLFSFDFNYILVQIRLKKLPHQYGMIVTCLL